MASLDDSASFLKGFTLEAIQQHRGGQKHKVSLILPRCRAGEPSGVSILRTISGYENFNETTEVLEMLKGGFGLIDAPQLFTSRVNEVFISNGARPTCSEPKIYLRMRGSDNQRRGGSGESSGPSPAEQTEQDHQL